MRCSRRWIAGLIVVVASFPVAGCRKRVDLTVPKGVVRPHWYSSERIEATLVDAADGKPIDGAAVLAVWRKIQGYNDSQDDWFIIREARSDANGRFTIPRWGPRTLDPEYYLDKRDPEIYILKPGYRYRYLDNDGMQMPIRPLGQRNDRVPQPPIKPSPNAIEKRRGEYARGAFGHCRWTGAVIPLVPVADEEEAAESLAAAMPISIGDSPLRGGEIYWEVWADAWKALPVEWQKRVNVPPVGELSAYLQTPRRGLDRATARP